MTTLIVIDVRGICDLCVYTQLSTKWASCQIRKIAGAHAPGMPGTFSPSPQVSDPDMHHGTCVTHVPWCMPGSLTSSFLWNRRRGKTFPGIPGACATCNFTYLVRGPWPNGKCASQNTCIILCSRVSKTGWWKHIENACLLRYNLQTCELEMYLISISWLHHE